MDAWWSSLRATPSRDAIPSRGPPCRRRRGSGGGDKVDRCDGVASVAVCSMAAAMSVAVRAHVRPARCPGSVPAFSCRRYHASDLCSARADRDRVGTFMRNRHYIRGILETLGVWVLIGRHTSTAFTL